jgi:ABC-2 type transport system permease protein
MIRLFRIAWRDYLAYVRTPGFWLSIMLMPVGLSVFATAPILISRSTPPPLVAVVDLTGQNLRPAIAQALKSGRLDGGPVAVLTPAPGAPFKDTADATLKLKPLLVGPRSGAGGPALDAAVILRAEGGGVAIDLWSRTVTDRALETTVGRAVSDEMRRHQLEAAGVSAATLKAADALGPRIQVYSSKGGGKVSLRDKLPGFLGFAMGMLLWMVVLTGAGMLLNSVIEEKSSRILEVLLSSASVTEIMGGKILGVACVTGTVLGVWLGVGGVGLTALRPDWAQDTLAVLLAHGMLAYLALYFVGGYLMFATLYVTVGAFCETTREAQTLLGPMMIILSIPVVFMSQAIIHPESPLLEGLSWVPIFTPFMMAASAATDPPWWEVVGTALLMFALTGLELWVAIPAFKSGALSSGRFDIRVFAASLMRRETA